MCGSSRMKHHADLTPKFAASGSGRRDRSAPDIERLLDLLNRLLGSTFRQILWRRALELELTYSQSQVLFYVEQNPGCHMGGVARAFGVTLAAVTQVVDRLEQKRLLTRGDDPEDRRVYVLAPTREGKDLVAELRSLQREGLEEVLVKVSARNRAGLINGLQALVDAASVAPRDSAGSRRGPRLSHGRIS
jgi:DNA-binding MarR family transcriptional regulator